MTDPASLPPSDPRQAGRLAGIPPASSDDWLRHYEELKAVARHAHEVVAILRAYFPVEGIAWVFDGAGTVAQDTGAEVLLLNALTRLDKSLYPARLPFEATLWDHTCYLNPNTPPLELQALLQLTNDDPYLTTPFRGSRSAVYDVLGRFANWAPLYPALAGVMVSHDRILQHYGWGKWVAGEDTASNRCPWRWPDVPPLPARDLESLERSATRFLDLLRTAAGEAERAQARGFPPSQIPLLNDASRVLPPSVPPEREGEQAVLVKGEATATVEPMPPLPAEGTRETPTPPSSPGSTTLPPDPADTQPVLECVPGGFCYRGKFLGLCGRPLAMLRALLTARHKRLSAGQLRDAMKVDDDAVSEPHQVVIDTACSLRRALQQAVAEAGRTRENPLPSKGRGKDLTYLLDLP
jgi:hypothetical protein